MPHASSSAATALRDHAERHVFLILPELEAVERRVLALLELADGDRELAARETGLDDEAVRRAAARGRKALRRRRDAPLRAARIAAIVLAVAALLAAIGFGISRLADRNGSQRAPWDGPNAPVVHPAPISGQ